MSNGILFLPIAFPTFSAIQRKPSSLNPVPFFPRAYARIGSSRIPILMKLHFAGIPAESITVSMRKNSEQAILDSVLGAGFRARQRFCHVYELMQFLPIRSNLAFFQIKSSKTIFLRIDLEFFLEQSYSRTEYTSSEINPAQNSIFQLRHSPEARSAFCGCDTYWKGF
jgi:hypothetical protein